MKNLIYTLAFIFVSNIVLGQTTSENYVKTTSYQVKTTDGTTKAENSAALQDDDKIESVTYLDGLGRPIQSISKQAGGGKDDIITPVIYDEYGRQLRDYLPYVRSTPSFNYQAQDNTFFDNLSQQYINKYPGEINPLGNVNMLSNPYSEKILEDSPLGRVLEQAAPGADWALSNNHTIKFDYQTNTFDINDPTNVNNDNVKLFSVSHPSNDTQQTKLEYDGHYSANELYKNITKDENWTSGKDHTTEEFKNKQGQVILKRTYDNNITHDTYYVYDDFGNLTFVLSPKGSKNILDVNDLVDSTVLNDLCYQYRYDYRNRLIEKKIPGKEWEYIVYDKLDRPILNQDANLRDSNDWLFTKYDKFDRAVYTGIMDLSISRDSLQTLVNGLVDQNETRIAVPVSIDNTDVYYDNLAYPTTNISKLHTINYYDDYNWDPGYNFEASYDMNLTTPGLELGIGNSMKKVSGGNSFSKNFESIATIEGDGYIQWTAKTNNKILIIGLSQTSDLSNNGFGNIDYGIYLNHIGRLLIYEQGVLKQIPTTHYSIGDVLRVERSIDQITYYKNDVAFHASTTPSTGTLLGAGSFYSNNGEVEDVFVGYSVLGQPFTSNAKGLATGSKVRVLDTNDWITSVSYYDEKGRSIYSISKNEYLDNLDAVSTYLDFTGKVIKTHSTHNGENKNLIVTKDDFKYDHTGRLLRHEQKINNEDKQLIAKNNYDELGQLKQKQVGGVLPNLSNYTNLTNVTVSNNLITKNINTNGWGTSGLSTVESISGDGYVSFTSVQPGSIGMFVCGLSYTDTNAGWGSIKYGISVNQYNQVSVRESGANRGIKTTHVPGDLFAVERRGTTIYYLKNGEPFYVSEIPTTNATMVGDLTIYHQNATIKNLVIVDLEKELQEVDYTYNIRGWLKTINDVDDLQQTGTGNSSDLFGFKINYNTNDYTGTMPLYNGNISETLWNSASVDPGTSETNIKRGYDYTYDALNRIESADFHKLSGVNQNNYYNLNTISYDRNGNILTLARSGVDNSGTLLSSMDNLSYTYSGNQLTDVLETGDHSYGFKDIGNIQSEDYIYDDNGNMTFDYNKGILISYNHLNLPVSVVKSGQEFIIYKYDATGTKLSKSVTENASTTITEYANNFIYKDGSLEFFSHPEGYIEDNGNGGFDYVYQYKDHLGNIRLSYSDTNNDGQIDASTEIIEENNYYPFGLKHKGYNNVVTSTNPAQKYKYNGMELEESLGVNWYEMDMRQYDPAIARWTSIDPITHFFSSPYNAFDNNPIVWADPSGADSTNFIKDLFNRSEDGETWTNNNNGTFSSNNGQTANCDSCPKIQLYEIGKYNNTLPEYDGSASGKSFNIAGGYSATPYLKNGEVVAYGVGRGGRLEYIVAAGSLGVFQENVKLYTTASNLFYINGYAPDENTISLSQGNLSGLAGMWGEALTNPQYYMYLATLRGFKGTKGNVSLKYADPQPNGISHSIQISNGRVNISGRTTTSGKFDFVITNSGQLKIGSGHYHLSGGAKSVQMAGRLKIHNGKVKFLNGNSGHYRPSPEQIALGRKILNRIINGN